VDADVTAFPINVCTIIAANYAPYARVLVDSFFAHNPDGAFTVLIVDDEKRRFDFGRPRASVLRLADIGLSDVEIGQLAAIYDVTELSTAVKPLLLRHLLAAGRGGVVYLDPDIKIYSSLGEIADLTASNQIVLIPHITRPIPRDGRRITDIHILSSGVYNLGFIGLGPDADAFIKWWWDKTRRDALVEHGQMLFTDQRWIDLVPALFGPYILKDPGYNVAYWNLHERDVSDEGAAHTVNGRPLRFFHFSGYDIRKPYLLSKHQADAPRILLSERPAVARLCTEYVADLKSCGLTEKSLASYGWASLGDGTTLDIRMRRCYRDALLAFEAGKGPEPPNPFAADGGRRFVAWLNEPAEPSQRTTVPRYLRALYRERPDLQRAFPDVPGDDVERFLDWVRTSGVREERIPQSLLPAVADTPSGPRFARAHDLQAGVNIAGYFTAELGVGEAARLLTRAVEASGTPYATVAYDLTASRQTHPYTERGDGNAPYDLNIVCVNSDRLPDFVRDFGPGFFKGRHTVGYWFWELELFPQTMHDGFRYVDEIWTATAFTERAIRAAGRQNVHTIPLPLLPPVCAADVTRESLGLPPGFMFLFVFDFFSILDRKNPIGIVDAFRRAFRPGEGPVLVIKAINGHFRLNELERVRAAAAGRQDILIVDEYYSPEQKNALLALCDCYVSLHRSEGLGLTMAEAMTLEKPVIATAYSGNLHFMNPRNSYLVDYVRGEVPAGCDPYPAGAAWAEPDVDQAAGFMRRVYENKAEAKEKARRGRQDILSEHSVAISAAAVAERLQHIRSARVTVGRPHKETAETMDVPDNERFSFGRLDQIVPSLTPTPAVGARRRLSGVAVALQRLLFRILRPYWWQQRQANLMLIDYLRDTTDPTPVSVRQQQAQTLWTRVDELAQANRQLVERVNRLESRGGTGDSRPDTQDHPVPVAREAGAERN
jgi:glycosyltransferase involved in cell wall biosynthesis